MEQLKEQYERDGFVVINNFFSVEEASHIVRCANTLESLPEEKYKWMIYHEGNKNKSRLENFINYNNDIKQILETKLKPLMNDIHGEDMTLFKEKLNWKYGGGNGFAAHQDHPAWSDFPPTFYSTISISANNSTIANGCLEFVRGQDKKGVYSYNKEGDGSLIPEIADQFKWIPLETTPRDILIFNSFTPHRSHKNNTVSPRRIFYFTFNKLSEGEHYKNYLNKKRKEFPPDIERDDTNVRILGNKYNLANPIV